MIILDASSVVALLRGEPAAPEVRALMREPRVGMPAPNLAEALYVLAGFPEVGLERARQALEALIDGGIEVVELDERRSIRAGELRSIHYHRSRRPLSLGDCLLLASAEADDAIASSDSGVIAVAGLEGLRAIPLPDSSGRRPR